MAVVTGVLSIPRSPVFALPTVASPPEHTAIRTQLPLCLHCSQLLRTAFRVGRDHWPALDGRSAHALVRGLQPLPLHAPSSYRNPPSYGTPQLRDRDPLQGCRLRSKRSGSSNTRMVAVTTGQQDLSPGGL